MDFVEQVRKAKAGDKEALIQLIMREKKDYYGLAYTLLQNNEDSMDAMQDMIVILYENIRKLRKEESFYSWSKTILVNCCRNILRKRNGVNLKEDHQGVTYIENYHQSEEKYDILTELKKLNPHQQEAIKLRYFLELDYESIAELTKTPLGTVKSRIFNGLAKLRESFGGEYA